MSLEDPEASLNVFSYLKLTCAIVFVAGVVTSVYRLDEDQPRRSVAFGTKKVYRKLCSFELDSGGVHI